MSDGGDDQKRATGEKNTADKKEAVARICAAIDNKEFLARVQAAIEERDAFVRAECIAGRHDTRFVYFFAGKIYFRCAECGALTSMTDPEFRTSA